MQIDFSNITQSKYKPSPLLNKKETIGSNGMVKQKYQLNNETIKKRWREMAPYKKDPVLDLLNANAPEGLRVDPEDVDILAELSKEDLPDGTPEERLQNAIKYLPDLLLEKQSKQQPIEEETTDNEITQGSRFNVLNDNDKNLFGTPKIPRFENMEDISVTEGASKSDVMKAFARNFGKSSANLASDVSNFMLDPVDSAKNLIKLAAGAGVNTVELLSGKEFGGKAGELGDVASLAGNYFSSRYGSLEGFSKASFEDPVGVFSDLVSVLGLGGAAVTKLTTKGSKLSSIGQSLQKVGSLDPANKVSNLIGKGYTKIGNLNQPKKPVIYLPKDIKSNVLKGFKPSTPSIKQSGTINNYVDKAWNAVKSIVLRKDDITSNVDGDIIRGKLPSTISELSEAIPEAKKSVYQDYIKEAEAAGSISRVDVKPVLLELKTLKSKMQKIYGAKNTIEYIDEIIADITKKGDLDVIDALDNTENLNAKLKAYYRNPNPSDIGKSVVDNMINNVLRKQIDATIDSSLEGSQYSKFKQEYGNLKTIENDVRNRAVVYGRKNAAGASSIVDIFSAGEAFNAITKLSPEGIIKAGVFEAIKRYRDYMNSPDRHVTSMFKKAEETIKSLGEDKAFASDRLKMKSLPYDEGAMTFGTSKARIGSIGEQTQGNYQYGVNEIGKENIRQPISQTNDINGTKLQSQNALGDTRTIENTAEGVVGIPEQKVQLEVNDMTNKKVIDAPKEMKVKEFVKKVPKDIEYTVKKGQEPTMFHGSTIKNFTLNDIQYRDGMFHFAKSRELSDGYGRVGERLKKGKAQTKEFSLKEGTKILIFDSTGLKRKQAQEKAYKIMNEKGYDGIEFRNMKDFPGDTKLDMSNPENRITFVIKNKDKIIEK